jgi:RNA polymerase sigma factor (TIGR02999 family)
VGVQVAARRLVRAGGDVPRPIPLLAPPGFDILGAMSDVTHLLDAAAAGDRQAAADLLPLVYDELRRLAAARMAGESPGHTLQPTALVHEAYLRLVGRGDEQRWEGRGHFFAAAAEAMRRILIEAARRKHGPERGGDFTRHDLDPDQAAPLGPSPRLLALDEALNRLAAIEPRAAEVVKLRYFAGMSVAEAAAVLGISPRTADNDWAAPAALSPGMVPASNRHGVEIATARFLDNSQRYLPRKTV